MKISKIPGLGRFGIYIDDLDFTNLSDDEWAEVGQRHLESLVTIIRNVKITPAEYEILIGKWGSPHNTHFYSLQRKYKKPEFFGELLSKTEIDGIVVDPEDKKFAQNVLNITAYDATNNPNTSVVKVTGMKKPDGSPLGMFAEGELLWHSNESGNLVFAPGVSLLGETGTVGSATGFITTADWYEEQSESFRSELDEMIVQHQFTPGKINPGLREEQDLLMYKNMCPEPSELPLVIKSPLGIKGLHYSINTINGIKGMSALESKSVFDQINKTLFVDKYIYDHWYQQDNDLCLFDNSITLHRRLGGITNRMCYRIQYQYSKLVSNWNPYLKEPFISQYNKTIEEFNRYI